jgi:hypothetical protein
MMSVLFLGAPMALITGLIIFAITDPRLPNREFRRLAEETGLSLLQSWLTPEQVEQWSRDRVFDVVGCDTGTRYRITDSTTMNVIELDKDGRYVRRWCFAPEGPVVKGDVLLAQKIALETMETRARAVANSQRGA